MKFVFEMSNERTLMTEKKNKFIIDFYDSFFTGVNFAIVMEYCEVVIFKINNLLINID